MKERGTHSTTGATAMPPGCWQVCCAVLASLSHYYHLRFLRRGARVRKTSARVERVGAGHVLRLLGQTRLKRKTGTVRKHDGKKQTRDSSSIADAV